MKKTDYSGLIQKEPWSQMPMTLDEAKAVATMHEQSRKWIDPPRPVLLGRLIGPTGHKPNTAGQWKSCARWPEGVLHLADPANITRDGHDTEAAAHAVCKRLEMEGLGGYGRVFPLETWVEPNTGRQVRRESNGGNE